MEMRKANPAPPVFSKVSHMSSTEERIIEAFRAAETMAGWGEILAPSIPSELTSALALAYASGPCHPDIGSLFRAFSAVGRPIDVRVVILGQDPYHGVGQADGLAFSVKPGVPLPPSLRNIFKEVASSCGGTPPLNGNLDHWAGQGVLLLNDVLSVAGSTPRSHALFGWQDVTGTALCALNRRPVAFMLWGSHARALSATLRALHPDHLILEAPHPSPLSAHRGFFGCGHFSQVNAWLEQRGEQPVEWFPSWPG